MNQEEMRAFVLKKLEFLLPRPFSSKMILSLTTQGSAGEYLLDSIVLIAMEVQERTAAKIVPESDERKI